MNDNFDYRAYLKSNRLNSTSSKKQKQLNEEQTSTGGVDFGDAYKSPTPPTNNPPTPSKHLPSTLDTLTPSESDFVSNVEEPVIEMFRSYFRDEATIHSKGFVKAKNFSYLSFELKIPASYWDKYWEYLKYLNDWALTDPYADYVYAALDKESYIYKVVDLRVYYSMPKDGEVNEMLKSKIKEHISSFFEAKKKTKEPEEEIDLGDEEITDEVPAEDIEGDIAPEEGGGEAPEGLTADEKAIQDSLKIAYDNAVQIGDDKLSKQIGNTITMFTRSHIVGAGGMAQ